MNTNQEKDKKSITIFHVLVYDKEKETCQKTSKTRNILDIGMLAGPWSMIRFTSTKEAWWNRIKNTSIRAVLSQLRVINREFNNFSKVENLEKLPPLH